MTLENSHYLWLLLLLPVFIFYAIYSYRSSNAWLYKFARRSKKISSFIASTSCLSLALVTLILCLTEPKVQYTRTVFNRSGIDIAVGIDVSKSMLAEDEMLLTEGKKFFICIHFSSPELIQVSGVTSTWTSISPEKFPVMVSRERCSASFSQRSG
jgi:Ca-activated chloride channel family protein